MIWKQLVVVETYSAFEVDRAIVLCFFEDHDTSYFPRNWHKDPFSNPDPDPFSNQRSWLVVPTKYLKIILTIVIVIPLDKIGILHKDK